MMLLVFCSSSVTGRGGSSAVPKQAARRLRFQGWVPTRPKACPGLHSRWCRRTTLRLTPSSISASRSLALETSDFLPACLGLQVRLTVLYLQLLNFLASVLLICVLFRHPLPPSQCVLAPDDPIAFPHLHS
eukprot:3932162-Rhodomonas_salina.2